MTLVTFNKKALAEYIGKSFSDTDLAHAVTFLGAPLEEIHANDLVVEVFPNRPDLLSEEGMARALAAFTTIKPGLHKYRAKNGDYTLAIDPKTEGIRNCAAGAVVKGLQLDDEKLRNIIQVQEKLHVSFGRNRERVSIGIYPLDKITFPLRFMALPMHETVFRPLESMKEMNGHEILEHHPTAKTYAHLVKNSIVVNLTHVGGDQHHKKIYINIPTL